MSKLVLEQQIPPTYNRADFVQIIRSLCNQVNPLSEGRLSARYAALTAAPTTGSFARGDIVWNSAPSSGGPVGWICVASGTPGTFYQIGGMPVVGTEVASTSGTAIDFTGIPAWVTQIELPFDTVSTNGTSAWTVQIGDSGGIETSGYTSASTVLQSGAAVSLTAGGGAGYDLNNAMGAADTLTGVVTLTLEDQVNNVWFTTCIAFRVGTSQVHISVGRKALSAALDRVRFTTVGGDTFDAGALNIRTS